ncbi:hypothetical protein MAPG_10423 [Magnaporthiopsis poae ATCC 64411]|uniref:Uncharacterized protein n=1 Tax=Magnaporthiopsis poae (strain ATCC 64411 / 73-15) TaxID=644358 RepID=A0A0C4ECJ6_MAGP6|nr:hypothetical protein MAPG_10423 [Magnaporthiopsis poae ATCC 64411]
MSSHNLAQTMPLNGFTIFQSTLGATLQFEPALQSPELDAMIDAYVPGSDTIQQKRAAVCVEFFRHAAQTGQTNNLRLFFPVVPNSFTAESPASLGDSGCGSGFNASPVVPDMAWDGSFAMATPTTPATPATPSSVFTAPSQNRVTKSKAAGSSSRKAGSRAAAATTNDFSHIPGMKILTKDGVDVTNSASRGSKTKAMREHAHLIRLLKACDSCKKKKVRCDPSHKRRAAGPAPAPAAGETTKTKKVKSASPPVTPQAEPVAQQASFQVASAEAAPFEAQLDALDSFDWDMWMQPEDDIFSLPIDYNYSVDDLGFLTPSSGSSGSPSQGFSPTTTTTTTTGLTTSFESPHSFAAGGLDVQAPLLQQPQLPYLHNDGHTGDYVDFTLYSPASSFLDEEPQELQSAGPSPSSAFIGWSDEPTTTGHERIEHQERVENRQPLQRVLGVARCAVLDCGASDPDRPRDDPGSSGRTVGTRVANPGNSLFAAAHNSLGGDVSDYELIGCELVGCVVDCVDLPGTSLADFATPEEASCGQDLYGGGNGGSGGGTVQSQQQPASALAGTDESKRKRKETRAKKTTPSLDQQSWFSSVTSDSQQQAQPPPQASGAPQAARSCAGDGRLSDINAGSMLHGNVPAPSDVNLHVPLDSRIAGVFTPRDTSQKVTSSPADVVTSSRVSAARSTSTFSSNDRMNNFAARTTSSGVSALRSTSNFSSSDQLVLRSAMSSPASSDVKRSSLIIAKSCYPTDQVDARSTAVIFTMQPASVDLVANHTRIDSLKAETTTTTTTTAKSTDTLAQLPQKWVSKSSAVAPLDHEPRPQVVLPTSSVFAKNLFGSWQSSWALLALIGFVLALSMQTQEAASALVSIIAPWAVSALSSSTDSPSSASPSSPTPQRSSACDRPEASTATNGNGPIAQLLGLQSAASRRVSSCLRRWTAICCC